MKSFEVVYTDKKEVACNGGVLGHPRIYLNMEDKGEVVCPYCSKKFVFAVEKLSLKNTGN